MKLWKDARLSLSITRLGLEYLAAMLLLGAFAANTGNNLLYVVFALMASLFLVSGWVSRKALRGITPRAVEEGNIFARVNGGIRVRLEDTASLRVRALEVRLEMAHATVEPSFHAGGAGAAEALVVLQARPERRGWCDVTALELRTRYPFGFLEKAWRFPLEQRLLVLPHPRAVLLHQAHRGETPHTVPRPGSASPEGARPFRAGDPLSRVHWKRTAQRGTPWIRTFEDESPAGLRLRLDLRAWPAGRSFEAELERLSGAILQARLQKREVHLEVVSTRGHRTLEGYRGCWRALALAEAEGAGPDSSEPQLVPAGAILDPRSALT